MGESVPRGLVALQEIQSVPAWSPDGRRIAFLSYATEEIDGPYGPDIAHVVNVAGTIYTAAADGSSIRQITSLPGDVWAPVYRPRSGEAERIDN